MHKDTYAVDLCREPCGEDKCGVEHYDRGDYLPRRDAKWYARNHHNRRGEGYHRGPKCDGRVSIVEHRHHHDKC